MSELPNRTKDKPLTPEEQGKLDEAHRAWQFPLIPGPNLGPGIEMIREEFAPKEAPPVVLEFLAKIRRERRATRSESERSGAAHRDQECKSVET